MLLEEFKIVEVAAIVLRDAQGRVLSVRKGGYRTKRVGFVVTFRLAGAEKSVLKLVGADLKDGLNVLVL